MQALYRVTADAHTVECRAPIYDHMMDLPCPQNDGIPDGWTETHPHCAALQDTLREWWPEWVLESRDLDDAGFFKVVPKSPDAAIIGRKQAVFDPERCDIIPMTRDEFIAAVRMFS